eukprot:GHVT01019227.1.p1 GENE.GHVT01019227.1~~GHVT01019227.1.p1  ORF type:complete len:115 (+),score=5.58 GHVT01019227.1:850-1194(+)
MQLPAYGEPCVCRTSDSASSTARNIALFFLGHYHHRIAYKALLGPLPCHVNKAAQLNLTQRGTLALPLTSLVSLLENLVENSPVHVLCLGLMTFLLPATAWGKLTGGKSKSFSR